MHNNENCLDYYWKLLKGVSPDKYGKSVYNLINTHRMARKGDLSGMKFDGIDFGNVPLNDLHFDNGGKSAQFIDCKFQELNFMTGHTENITHAVFSGDGRFVLSVDEANTFIWWETESGLQRGKYMLPEEMLESDDEIMGIGFSEQNEKTPEPLGLLAYTKYGVCFSRTLALSEEETWEKHSLLTADDCEVIVYSPDYTHALIRKRHTDAYLDEVIERMAADPEHKPVEQVYWVYDLSIQKTLAEIRNAIGKGICLGGTWEILTNSYEKAAISHNNQYLAMSDHENQIKIWNISSEKQPEVTVQGTGAMISAFGLSADGGICVFSDTNDKLMVWDRRTKEKAFLNISCFGVHHISVSANGQYAVIMGLNRDVLLDMQKNQEEYMDFSSLSVDGFGAFSGAEQYCLTAHSTFLHIRNTANYKSVCTLGGNSGQFEICLSPDANIAAFSEMSEQQNRLLLWNIQTEQVLHLFGDTNQPILVVSFSPDAKKVVVIKRDGTADLYHCFGDGKSFSKQIIKTVMLCTDFLWGKNDVFYIGDAYSGLIYIWDTRINDFSEFNVNHTSFTSAAISPNQSYLAYTTEMQHIELVNCKTNEHHILRPATPENPFGHYKVLEITDDGKEILLVSELTKEGEWWTTKEVPVFRRKETISDDIRNYLFPSENKYPAESINGEYRIPAQDGEPEKVLYLIPNLYIKGCRFINTDKIDPQSKVGKILYQYGGELITKGEDKT